MPNTRAAVAAITLAASTALLPGGCATAVPQVAASDDSFTLENNPLRGTALTGTFQPDWGLPLAALDDNGEPEGFVYEIANAAAEALGATIDVEPNAFATTIPGVQSGKYDIGLGTDATVERQEVVDVVSTYKSGYQTITVIGHGDLPDSWSDWSGLSVAVIAGSSYIEPIEDASATLEADGKEPIEILSFADKGASFAAVQSGRADATLATISSAGYLEQIEGDTWKRSGPQIDVGYSGFSVNKESGYADLWRIAIDKTIEDGTYQEILDKYGYGDGALTESAVNPAS